MYKFWSEKKKEGQYKEIRRETHRWRDQKQVGQRERNQK